MERKIETGWLIERVKDGAATGRCLGVENLGKIKNVSYGVGWTSPDRALRFARKLDAELAAKLLCREGSVLITEHEWS